jgi:hypothetical protein
MTLCVAFVSQKNCMSVPQNEKSTFINCISMDNALFFAFKKRGFTDTPEKAIIKKNAKK